MGDNVRLLEWGQPFAIPGLSVRTRTLLRLRRAGRLPEAALAKAYDERAQRVAELLASPEFSALLGVRPGVDSFVPVGRARAGDALAFQQVLADGTARLRVANARVTFHFAPDGSAIGAVASGFQPDIELVPGEVTPGQALETAVDALEGIGAPPLELAGEPESFVFRVPLPGAGVRRAAVVRRVNDRRIHSFAFRNPDRPESGEVVAHVDSVTGELTRLFPMSAHADVALWMLGLTQDWKLGPPVVSDLFAFPFCVAFDGRGTDPDGLERFFSTTYDPTYKQYYLSSCNEYPERLIKSGDVLAFWADPASADLEKIYVLKDDDNLWDAPANPVMPHAVNTQYWGERVLRFFKRRGYTHRRSGAGIRYRAYLKTGGIKNFAEWISSKTDPTNGVIHIHPAGAFADNPGASLATSADPAWVAHEFGHSVVNDVLKEPLGDKTTETASIAEGLSDCFAALVLNESFSELGPQYQSAGQQQGPWKLTYGSFRGAFPETAGFPNLVNPHLTWFGSPLKYSYWSGQRSVDAPFTPPDAEKHNASYEVNSTLFGGVCRLLALGGPNPTLSAAYIETGGGSEGLAPGNPALGAERTSELLVETITTAKQFPTSFHDLIGRLGQGARFLAQNRWLESADSAEQRVLRAFGEYGFGRKTEGKAPHGSLQIVEAAKSENLIASGLNYFRPIEGSLCTKEEDFFVLNEEARNQDSVQYSLATTQKVEVRLYEGKPCPFDEPGTIKYCARDHQIYPPVDSNGATPPAFEPPSKPVATLPPKAPGQLTPIYVGLRIKAPATACKAAYTLTVLLKRGSGSVYP